MNTNRRPHRKNPRERAGKIPAVPMRTTIEAGPGFVTAVIHIDDNSTIGLKFVEPEHMLEFFRGLMEHAVIAWPDNEFVRYYAEEE